MNVLENYLLKIGILYKKSIEIGSNSFTNNLIFNYNFHALFFDLSDRNVHIAIEYYTASKKLDLVTFVNGLITMDNISEIIKSLIKYNNSYVDVLVINIKNNGYWILKELIKYIYPRIIIVEYQHIIPHDVAIVAPYDSYTNHKEYDGFYGASIKAYKLLLVNYICVYCNNSKAYFIHKDENIDCENIEYDQNLYNQYKKIKDLPWIHIK